MERDRQKSDSVKLLRTIKEIAFKVNTGKNIYTTIWKVKRKSANLFQNKKTPKRHLYKFLSNVQVAKHKECSIWLDNGTIMSKLKKKGFRHHMGYRKFQGNRKIKRSCNGENSGDGLHTVFITPI